MNKAHEPLATRSTTAKIKTNSDGEALDNIRSSGDILLFIVMEFFDLVHPGHILAIWKRQHGLAIV